MKASFEMVYLGIEEKKSKNGKPYTIIGLLQGFEGQEFFVGDEVRNQCKDLKPYQKVIAELDIVSRKGETSIYCNEVRPIEKR